MERHQIDIIGGEIDWKNFSGVERKAVVKGRMQIVNAAGKRGFAAIIDPLRSKVYFDGELITDPDFGQRLFELGYKVNIRAGREEGEPSVYRLPVEVRFPDDPNDPKYQRFVPHLYQVTEDGREIPMDEHTICNFDESDIDKVNITITNSTSIDKDTGEERAKTWCNKGYFWVREDRISPRYQEYNGIEE